MFAAQRRRGRGADRRAAFHRAPAGGARRAPGSAASPSPSMSAPAPSCRSRPRTPRTTACTRRRGFIYGRAAAARINAARARGGRIVAVGTTSLRLLESAAGRGRPDRGPSPARPTLFITPGLSLPRGRSAVDQFPPAALDPVHAGRRLRRARADEGGLCPCDRAGLSLLFLWRCLPAVSGARAHDRLRLHAPGARRRGAARADCDRAWHGRDARLHAGRHGRHGQGDAARGGRAPPAPRSSSATPII